MAYYNTKYSIGLNSQGYIIAERGGKRYYQKKRAPTFVNKFGGGDSSYRDASFWQYFVQTNWRNGAKQMKFDDAGKFWKSSDIDTTTLEQIKLSRALSSAGQLATDVKVNCIEAWRSDGVSPFGNGGDGALTISADTTDAPIDSACTGTSGMITLSATNASFASAQKVLIIQMYGTGKGNKEERTISSYTAGTITLTEPLTNTYATGAQVIVGKQYTTVTIDSTKTLTAKAWNGTVGGILFFYANTTTTVTGTITGTGKGFAGGSGVAGGQGYQGNSATGAGTQSTSANDNSGGGGTQDGGSQSGGGGGGGHAAAGTAGQTKGGASGGSAGGSIGSSTLSSLFMGGSGGGGSRGSGVTGNAGNGGNGGGIIYIITKAITVTGSITNAGANGTAGSDEGSGGGGGAGGSILLKSQTATLGTTLITAAAGSGGAGGINAGTGGAGSVGRIHLSYLTSFTGTTTPTIDSSQDATLADTAASTTSVAYAGASNGKIYTWDNATTWTEVFDTRQLTQFDTGTDTGFFVGDDGGTEKATAQGFQVAAAGQMKGVRVYLKKNAGTPSDITVRIETNSTDKPSGTLVDASATGTITAFTTTTDAWYTVEFSSAFSLAATTTYWIVLKTAAAGNDNNYKWEGKSTSGYSGGTNALSTDGGSTWTASTGDAYFRVLGNTTSVNCSLVTKVGGTKKIYFGTGNPEGTINGDARLYSFDGTTWALTKTFVTPTESVINSMTEYTGDTNVYIGIGPQARIQKTSDFSTFTVSKDVDVPQNPGYIYAIKEYNSFLYAGGGSPELVPSQKYNGFLNYYDQTTWRILYPFDFTVVQSCEFYDAYLFLGTYHGQLYVYDTSSLNPLFSFKDQYEYEQSIYAMKYFDDKLYVGLYPNEGTSDTNAGVWVFERHGLYNAHTVSGVTGYRCFAVVNGTLLVGTGDNGYVYKLSTTTYSTQGWYQSSYFDANLPSIDKLYKEVTIKHDALAANQSVVVYYRFKEDDAWTTLGTSSTLAATEKTMSFATATYSKKITLKVELNTVTTTASPKVTEVIMKYTLYPERKWMWTMRLRAKKALQLFDRSTEARTATQIRSNLEDLMSSQSLYTFVDVDSTSYTVLVQDIDQSSWVVNSDDVNEDEVVITLLEA